MPFIARRAVLALFAAVALVAAPAAQADAGSPPAPPGDVAHIDLSSTRTTGTEPVDLTAEPIDIWQRVRQGFAMPDLYVAEVTDRQIWYVSRPGALRTMFERGRKYLFHIVEELEKRGMPTELALLPLVESAYNPMAYSSAKASGLWQFIPSTGKDFALEQNWWVDERRDILQSTEAALTYLQALYEMHGDWHLALASYNWGENAVMRAVNKNKAAGLPTDFASLTMPAETRQYVPKLQALKNIIANPELFGIRLPEIPNEPYFTVVSPGRGMDLTTAARLAEMPVKDFLELNPSFNRPVIPGGASHTLVIPVDRAPTFQANLDTADQPLLNWQTHTLQRGQSLDSVAREAGISAAKLREVNGLPARARPGPGYTLLVPRGPSIATIESAPVLAPRLANAPPPKQASVRLGARGTAKAKPSTRKATPKRGTRPPAKSTSSRKR